MKQISLFYFFILCLFTSRIFAESKFLYISPGIQIGINSNWEPFCSSQITFGYYNPNNLEYIPGLTIGVRFKRIENGWVNYNYYDAQVSYYFAGFGFGMINGDDLLPTVRLKLWAGTSVSGSYDFNYIKNKSKHHFGIWGFFPSLL